MILHIYAAYTFIYITFILYTQNCAEGHRCRRAQPSLPTTLSTGDKTLCYEAESAHMPGMRVTLQKVEKSCGQGCICVPQCKGDYNVNPGGRGPPRPLLQEFMPRGRGEGGQKVGAAGQEGPG